MNQRDMTSSNSVLSSYQDSHTLMSDEQSHTVELQVQLQDLRYILCFSSYTRYRPETGWVYDNQRCHRRLHPTSLAAGMKHPNILQPAPDSQPIMQAAPKRGLWNLQYSHPPLDCQEYWTLTAAGRGDGAKRGAHLPRNRGSICRLLLSHQPLPMASNLQSGLFFWPFCRLLSMVCENPIFHRRVFENITPLISQGPISVY
jgi:hypothetical protein